MSLKWKLRNLINITNFYYHSENTKNKNMYNKLEKETYESISSEDIINLMKLIKEEINIPPIPFIKDDISLNNKQVILKKIYFNLDNELKNRNKLEKDNNSKELLEMSIRRIFLILIKNYTKNTLNQDTELVETLNNIIYNIEYLYQDDELQTINVENDKYIEKLIVLIIDQISKYNEESLQDDIIYAYVIAYQTLLRSLFILLNNKEKINNYCEYISKKDNINIEAKNIILTAIIANRHERLDIDKIRSYKDE